jgi:hypothetical protein
LARFDCARGRQFLPLGRGVEKIVSVDRNRHTVIFDTRTESVRAGPDARHVKWHGHGGAWAEAGGRLYHLGRGPGYEDCLDFEALTYDRHREDWFWNLLPSPQLERYMNATIESFADAGAGAASAIRISTSDGTYAFDAARVSWRKEGDWVLPFRGRARYVADYGLWFGFTDGGASDLCARGRPEHRRKDGSPARLGIRRRLRKPRWRLVGELLPIVPGRWQVLRDQVHPGDGQGRAQHHDGGGGHARRRLGHQGEAIANGQPGVRALPRPRVRFAWLGAVGVLMRA